VLHSNFGCCIGTIEKSATYKIFGAAQRRAVPIRELVENKSELRLKKKSAVGFLPVADGGDFDGGWRRLDALRMFWVAHAFGF